MDNLPLSKHIRPVILPLRLVHRPLHRHVTNHSQSQPRLVLLRLRIRPRSRFLSRNHSSRRSRSQSNHKVVHRLQLPYLNNHQCHWCRCNLRNRHRDHRSCRPYRFLSYRLLQQNQTSPRHPSQHDGVDCQRSQSNLRRWRERSLRPRLKCRFSCLRRQCHIQYMRANGRTVNRNCTTLSFLDIIFSSRISRIPLRVAGRDATVTIRWLRRSCSTM